MVASLDDELEALRKSDVRDERRQDQKSVGTLAQQSHRAQLDFELPSFCDGRVGAVERAICERRPGSAECKRGPARLIEAPI